MIRSATRAAIRPINPALAWAPALIVSAFVHTMMVAVLKDAVEPDPIPFTEEIHTKISMSPMKVPAHRAEAQEAEGEAAEAAQTGGERLGVQAVPSSRARPVAAVGQAMAARAPKSTVAPAARPEGEVMPAAQAAGARLPVASVAVLKLPPATTTADDMAAVAPAPAPVAATAPSGTAVAATAPAAETLAPARSRTAALAASDSQGRRLAAAPAPALPMAAAAPLAEALTPAQGRGAALAGVDAPATAVAAADAPTQTVTTVEDAGPALASADLPTRVMLAATAPAQTVAVSESRGTALATAKLPAATMVAVAAPAQALASASPVGLGIAPVSAPVIAETERLASAAAGGQAIAEIAPAAVAGVVAPTSATTTAVAMEAAVAWSGEIDTVLDEKSLAAIQSFMQPGEVTQSASFAGSVRDGIGDALAQFPCSRLQAAFQPETGGLEIRGHVPVPALRAEVVTMLEQAVGGAIPIGGSVMVLPAPQCGVLDAVEGLGFPQSTDQENDPLEVGREAQAQLLSFEEGQRVVFALQAPEFDAHIYLDYYDKDGNVVHVLPNQYIEDNRRGANTRFAIGETQGGGEAQGGGAGFEMRVTPPFSQDIAIVFGATRPLYDGLRPLVEDAAGYLAWLRERINELRAEDPAFRGEWVYLFVRTGPRGAFAP